MIHELLSHSSRKETDYYINFFFTIIQFDKKYDMDQFEMLLRCGGALQLIVAIILTLYHHQPSHIAPTFN